ncbi:hypothetical protein BKA61DRAFT_496363, partial [Leptodontidium sp. MPI-SDFR-AT-0119]
MSTIQPCLFPTEKGQNEDSWPLQLAKLPRCTPDSLSVLGTKDQESVSCMLRAAWGLVLRSYLGTSDVCFGSLASKDDSWVNSERNSDFFSRLYMCQLSLSGNLSVRDALQQARTESLQSLPNFELQHSENERQLTENSLVNTFVSVTHGNISAGDLKHVKGLGQLDLFLHVILSAESMEPSLFYRVGKVSHWQATNTIHSFHEALQGIAMNGSGTISDIQLFGSRDQELLDSWKTAPPEPMSDLLHYAIARQAIIQPHAPAICSREIDLSYEELNTLATRVASRLVKHGVGPEVMVPLYFEKSAWAIVAMLAVLKAGGAIVALDPQLPQSRLRAILKQISSPVLITSALYAHQNSDLGFDESASVIVSKACATEADPEITDFTPSMSPSSPAYAIFTSGSTGEPKGVIITHEGICTGCATQCSAMSVFPSSRVIQFASYTWDVSNGEIFTPLFAGGCVCVPNDEERNDIVKAIKSLRANYMHLTPMVLSMIRPVDVPSIQTVVSVGEAMTKSIRDQWASHVKLLNAYGPTECSLFSAVTRANPGIAANNIGRAIGCRCWVVDWDDPTRLAPVGCIGELFIEGGALARGYLNDQKKTEASFINNPPWIPSDSSSKPKRAYKTGDFVQYSEDGSMNYLGRRDLQVKIHGQRVELGDIEHQLKVNFPAYSSVAVECVRLASRPDEPLLFAFICEGDDNSATTLGHNDGSLLLPLTESLRSKLTAGYPGLLRSLPAHMVPSHFAPLRRMPVTFSRKLDRIALRQMAYSLSLEDSQLFRPAVAHQEVLKTPMELSLQALWGDLLHLSPTQIGPESNFFLLGGTSMTVIKLIRAARDRQIDILAADIFEYPTLRGLSSRVSLIVPPTLSHSTELEEQKSRSFRASLSESLPFDAANIEEVSEITDTQKILLFYNYLRKASGFIRISLAFEGGFDAAGVEAACRSAIAEHPILRTVFISNGDQMLQVVLKACPINFRRVSCEEWQLDPQADDCVTNFDRFGAPFVHVVIVEPGSEPARLIIQFSHAQYDAFSIPILIKSIHTLQAGNRRQPAPKFSKFISTTQVNQAASELYWRRLLEGSKLTILKSQSRSQYAFSHFRLKRQLIPSTSMTPSIFKAAWSMVLAQLSGHDDVVFGEVVAGRNVPVQGIDQMVGPCFNIIPIRMRSQPGTCQDLLDQIEEQHHSGITHENLGTLAITERCTTWP